MANNSLVIPALGGGSGSAYRIGDGYVLTAGHVVYEWNQSFISPSMGSPSVALD